MGESTPVLEMTNIKKRFGGTYALNGVDLKLHKGEVLGLVGENGAGKSTLMKILSGAHSKDEGEIRINGEPVEILSADHAQKLGISIIYQELSLFLDLNAVENIFIHREISKGKRPTLYSMLNKEVMRQKVKTILHKDLDVDFDIDIPVRDLRLSERQLIEIARSIGSNAEIIIMDEPTEALESGERLRLFQIIAQLKAAGKSIIYVSHQLDELLRISDRVMILRDGRNIADSKKNEIDVPQIISLMIGKALTQQYPEKRSTPGEVLLKVDSLSKRPVFNDVSFTLRKGEVLGIAGLAGSGKSELIRALFGIDKYDKGSIMLKGKDVKIRDIHDGISNKLAFLPSERKTEGLFLKQSINWNLSIASLKKISKGKINRKKENENTDTYKTQLGIKTSSNEQMIGDLSGGNQQKVMLARWMLTDPEILLVEEPTRGIDVNAKSDVYKLIIEFVEKGKGVIVVSSESPELLGICDRILVMFEGKVAAELDVTQADEKLIAYYTVQETGGDKDVS